MREKLSEWWLTEADYTRYEERLRAGENPAQVFRWFDRKCEGRSWIALGVYLIAIWSLCLATFWMIFHLDNEVSKALVLVAYLIALFEARDVYKRYLLPPEPPEDWLRERKR